MGFGTLLIGYVFAFVFQISGMMFTDIIGALIMLVGLSKLAAFGKNFFRAMWADILYLLICSARVMLVMFRVMESDGIGGKIFAVAIAVSALILQFFIFAGIHFLAAEVGMEKEAQKAKNSLVRIFTYYLLSVIAFFIVPMLGNTVGNITSLLVTVYGLVVIFMNLALIHSCYCGMCLKGQETGERKQSKYEWVNKFNEKTDKLFDGAFLRPPKPKKTEVKKEESEPGYLRVKRKKQGKRKK